MKASELAAKLDGLTTRQPLTIIGAAVIDVIADAYALPYRGCDIELKQQSVNIGGCALNIAIALKRLGIAAQNALPVGQGVWADIIRHSLEKQNITTVVQTDSGDNGWCLALVEPDGERTFMSFSGVENQWSDSWLASLSVVSGSLVYLSGYQLAAPCGERLVSWLENLHNATPFIDFGPRIADIPASLIARIMALHPVVSLNRQEADVAADLLGVSADVQTLGRAWQEAFRAPVIIRQDKAGAWYFDAASEGIVAPFPATVVDTIGAGDSHAGGTLAGLAAGWSLAEAVTLGNAVAAYVVSHRGGDCAPTLAELRTRLLLTDENV
ncbi:PfkB family carbohydrate kinase [Pectobacterium brasiliense]|uniref:PfkB family carbohydrate kinase n=1 Tax=Pectobacterium brasiliense TaxID=180957 RepID=UPI00069A3E3C|nr:PfkB family carbohydrate kinase [Pectobacterium brasiliense]MCG5049131.1 PfkB family carbohydrate kinase [Pectobacterium brasiliense]